MADEGAKERKILVGVLSGFCVVIAALIVAVIVANVRGGEEKEQAMENVMVDALVTATDFDAEIKEKINNDNEYTPSDAAVEYEDAINNSDGDLKFYLTRNYAMFAYDYLGGIENAVEIMSGIFDEIENDDFKSMYYEALGFLYTKAGRTEEAAENFELARTVVPAVVVSQEELMQMMGGGR